MPIAKDGRSSSIRLLKGLWTRERPGLSIRATARITPSKNSASSRLPQVRNNLIMKRVLSLFCLLLAPMAAQEYKIAVVSMLHAHVWLHLGTMLKGDQVKLVGVSETLPDLIAR